MVKKKKLGEKKVWFKNHGQDPSWGFIPANCKGCIALIILIALNVFSANYFDVMNAPFRDVSKFLVVFLFSLVVFILLAKKKTKRAKNGS